MYEYIIATYDFRLPMEMHKKNFTNVTLDYQLTIRRAKCSCELKRCSCCGVLIRSNVAGNHVSQLLDNCYKLMIIDQC